MFPLLIKIRLISARNSTRDALRRFPLVTVGLGLLGTGLFLLVYLGFLVFFRFAARLHVLEETVFQTFYFLFLFLLASAVPFISSTLLHSADYNLLFNAPIPPRTVIAAKLLDATVTNALQFTVLGIPAIVAAATALELPLWGWLFLPLLIALFALLPALLTAFGLLLALAFFGMARLRSAITLMNAVMALTVCITIVLEARHLPVRPTAFGATVGSVASALPSASPSPSAHLAPSAWFASSLLGMGGRVAQAGENLLLILLVVGTLYTLCILLGSRLISAASVAEENTIARVSAAGVDESRRWRSLLTPPLAALILKDFKYMMRDSVLLSQLTMPLILFLVPFLLAIQDPSMRAREELYPFACMMTGIILFMQTSILSLSCIGLESRSFWLLLNSPNSRYRLLLAKLGMSSLFTVGTGLLLTLGAFIAFGMPLPVALIQGFLVVVCSCALCGLGVGISAMFPRFIYENPAHRVSVWALVLGFFAYVGYLFTTALLFGLAWLLALYVAPGIPTTLLWLVTMLLFLSLSATVLLLPLVFGARRLETYQWEH